MMTFAAIVLIFALLYLIRRNEIEKKNIRKNEIEKENIEKAEELRKQALNLGTLKSVPVLEAELRIYQQYGEKYNGKIADCYKFIGFYLISGGKFNEAMENFENALRLYTILKNEEYKAHIYARLGEYWENHEDLGRTRENYNNAVNCYNEHLKSLAYEQFSERAFTYQSIANIYYLHEKNSEKALPIYKKALSCFIRAGDFEHIYNMCNVISQIYSENGDKIAAEKYRAALEIVKEIFHTLII